MDASLDVEYRLILC